MKRGVLRDALSILSILLVGSAIAWAGSQNGVEAMGVSLFALCAGLALLLNWLLFLPSYLFQTEHYFDLCGSLTYLALVSCAFLFNPNFDSRSLLLAALVAVWAIRLGTFLFLRVKRAGGDGRFDSLKPRFSRFWMTWSLQALWVFVTLSCALAAMTSTEEVSLGVCALVGSLLWILGFSLEVVADAQKSSFRGHPANRHRFIESGLWAWSRHPNYLGEIALWLGIAIVAFPVLSGWQYATLIAPIFVFILLTRISGVPMLEARGRKKWGMEPAYLDYLNRTPRLILRPPRKGSASS